MREGRGGGGAGGWATCGVIEGTRRDQFACTAQRWVNTFVCRALRSKPLVHRAAATQAQGPLFQRQGECLSWYRAKNQWPLLGKIREASAACHFSCQQTG